MKTTARRMPARGIALALMSLLAVSLLGGCAPKAADPLMQDASYAAQIDAYLRDLANGDYAAMYAMIGDASQGAIDEATFVSRHKNILGGIAATNIAYEGITVEAPPALATAASARATPTADAHARVVRYRVTMDTSAGPIAYDNAATVRGMLVDDAPAFRIDWNASMIFPDLGPDDKVRVYTQTGERGRLIDRNGLLLAGNGAVKTIGLVPGKLGASRETTLAQVAQLLGMPLATIERALSASWVTDDVFVPLKAIPSSDDATRAALVALPGVLVRDSSERVYPLGEAAAHLTGYVQTISQDELAAKALSGYVPDATTASLKNQGYAADSRIGKTGLELAFEDRLRGIDGRRIVIEDKYGDEKSVLAEIPVRNGEDVTLTIDSTLQNRLYTRMIGDRGAAVVLQPYTGEVLALISAPGYDPNAFVLGLSDEQWQALQNDADQPMFNRYRASFVPGSCFKPIVAGIGLTTGTFGAQDNFGASGRAWQAQADWGDYYVTTLTDYGSEATLANALLYSDNIYFAKAALKIGAERFAQELNRLGFAQPLPFVQTLTASTFGNAGSFESQIELADSGYGQGRLLVNPVHLASLYTAFLNGGAAIAPTLEMPSGAPATVAIADAFGADAAATIRDELVQVVENPSGTAHEAYLPGVTIAAKTGTAEIKKSKTDTTGTELGWYVAFTADDGPDPRLVVCMIENVKGRGGSKYALRVGQAVFE